MIERFEARVREEGLPDAEGRVMDCHALQLDDNTFDVTGSQFGVMLVDRARYEMVQVTKPGGRVLVVAYGLPAELSSAPVYRRPPGGRPGLRPGSPTIRRRSSFRSRIQRSCASGWSTRG